MAVTNIDFEDGSNGATLTTGNAGTAAVSASGGALTYSTAAAMHGALGMKADRTVSTGAIYGQWSIATASTQLSVRFYFNVTAIPTGTQMEIFRLGNASDTNVFQFHVSTAGQFYWTDTAGANQVNGPTVSPNTWYRVGAVFDAATGDYTFHVYLGDSATPITGGTFTGTGYALGGAAFTFIRAGITSNGDVGDVVYTDDLAYEAASTTEIPAVANQPPTANAGPDQTNIEPWSTVTLDGSGSADSDGTIASYAWTQTAGTAVTLSNSAAVQPTFTAPAALRSVLFTFQLQVTDNDGATSTDSVSITVLAATDAIVAGGVLVPLHIHYVSAT